jgi:ribosomal protein L4
MAGLLKAMRIDRSCLISPEVYRREVWLSARNLARVAMAPVAELNAYEVLRRHRLVLTRVALDRLLSERGAARPTQKRTPAAPPGATA